MPNTKHTSRSTHAVKPLNVQPTKEATTSQNVNPKGLNNKDYIKYLTKQLNKKNAKIEALKDQLFQFELSRNQRMPYTDFIRKPFTTGADAYIGGIYKMPDEHNKGTAIFSEKLNKLDIEVDGRVLMTLSNEVVYDLHNCIASFFYSKDIDSLPDSLKAEQSLLFDLLQSAIANSDLEDSFLKGLFVEQCKRFLEFINIGYKMYFDNTLMRN